MFKFSDLDADVSNETLTAPALLQKEKVGVEHDTSGGGGGEKVNGALQASKVRGAIVAALEMVDTPNSSPVGEALKSGEELCREPNKEARPLDTEAGALVAVVVTLHTAGVEVNINGEAGSEIGSDNSDWAPDAPSPMNEE